MQEFKCKLVHMGSDAELRRLEKKIQKKEAEKKGQPLEKSKEEKKPAQRHPEGAALKRIVRVADTNLDADKTIIRAAREIKGIGPQMANAVAKVCGFREKFVRDLSEDEIRKLEDIMSNPSKYNIPSWMLNRRKDPQSGEDRHLIVSSLDFTHAMDINEMKKWKTYKGVRHSLGLPVRGQRTRSSFRQKGITVGVKRKKEEPAKAGASKEKK